MTQGKRIPFVDLIALHEEIETDLIDAVTGVIRSAGFVGGPKLEEFERDYAAMCDARHCVGVSSGTDALRFALIAAGVGAGDLVITVPNTFVATIEAIIQAGATPGFVDVDSRTYNMSPDSLRAFLETECEASAGTGLLTHRKTGRVVKAVVPVHLYGQMCDMDPILDLAEGYGLVVVEDACQAHGSEYFSEKKQSWLKAGSVGRAAAFSFYPGKNLGACGEGGAVTTNDEEIAARVRMIRDHGQSEKYHHVIEGYNGRLHSLQAAILEVKLPHRPRWNEARRKAAETYDLLLAGVEGIRLPFELDRNRSVYHLYVVATADRDSLQGHLAERNIATGLHYPVPLHLQEGYRYLGHREGDFPVSEKAAGEILSLPMYPHIGPSELEAVAAAILEFVDESDVCAKPARTE